MTFDPATIRAELPIFAGRAAVHGPDRRRRYHARQSALYNSDADVEALVTGLTQAAEQLQ